MKILLVVSNSNDVFIYNLAKWLKLSFDCTLHAFELFPSSGANQEDSAGLFETVESANWTKWWGRNRLSRFFLSPIMIAHQLDEFISCNYYDAVHVQGVWFYVPFTKKLKSQTTRLFVSFWGNEHIEGKVWHSHRVFQVFLNQFMKTVDGITGAIPRLQVMHGIFPNTPLYESRLGIASLDTILSLDRSSSKEESKKYWRIPINKTSVLIGYSGKRLHNHLSIIKELNRHVELYDKIHLLAPMTRGAASDGYVGEVEDALAHSGFSYTILKNGFLSDDEIARLRHATDIVFQFSDNDAYSRSIIESICAGALLVYGNWIKYKELLQKDRFAACEVSDITEGIKVLGQYIESPDPFMRMIEGNVSVGGKQYLWSECIKDFIGFYTGTKDAEVF